MMRTGDRHGPLAPMRALEASAQRFAEVEPR